MTQLFMLEKICVFSRKFQRKECRKHFASPGILQFFHNNIKQKILGIKERHQKDIYIYIYIYYIEHIFNIT